MIDLTGKKFGRLTVIKRVFPNRNKQPLWLCKCDCGTEKIIMGCSLRNGNTKSCGCLRKEIVSLNSGLANMRMLIGVYKGNAKKRGLRFELTEEQFKELTQKDCYYCGAKPTNVSNWNNSGDYIYNGLDRVDNTKGYTVDNVVPCCKRCNRSKSNYSLQEFKDWNERVYNKFKGNIK